MFCTVLCSLHVCFSLTSAAQRSDSWLVLCSFLLFSLLFRWWSYFCVRQLSVPDAGAGSPQCLCSCCRSEAGASGVVLLCLLPGGIPSPFIWPGLILIAERGSGSHKRAAGLEPAGTTSVPALDLYTIASRQQASSPYKVVVLEMWWQDLSTTGERDLQQPPPRFALTFSRRCRLWNK